MAIARKDVQYICSKTGKQFKVSSEKFEETFPILFLDVIRAVQVEQGISFSEARLIVRLSLKKYWNMYSPTIKTKRGDFPAYEIIH